MSGQTLAEFVGGISKELGREVPPARPSGSYDASRGLDRAQYDPLTSDDLAAWFSREGGKIGIAMRSCAPGSLADTIVDQVRAFGGGRAVFADDPRADACGLERALFEAGVAAARWDASKPADSVDACAQADVGITFPFAGIAHSATVAQQCDERCGRAVSLLPPAHIAVVAKGAIVPRMIDVLERIDDEHALLPSTLAFITGPSATADIELVRVVGVHGPMRTSVIIVDE